jgi:hypothetical protein
MKLPNGEARRDAMTYKVADIVALVRDLPEFGLRAGDRRAMIGSSGAVSPRYADQLSGKTT